MRLTLREMGEVPKKLRVRSSMRGAASKKKYCFLLYDVLYMGVNSQFKVSISNSLNARRPFVFRVISDVYLSFSSMN